jgi:hypothetical protein
MTILLIIIIIIIMVWWARPGYYELPNAKIIAGLPQQNYHMISNKFKFLSPAGQVRSTPQTSPRPKADDCWPPQLLICCVSCGGVASLRT